MAKPAEPERLAGDARNHPPAWIPGVNNHGKYSRWAFAEFTEVYQMESDFEAKIEAEFNKMIERIVTD